MRLGLRRLTVDHRSCYNRRGAGIRAADGDRLAVVIQIAIPISRVGAWRDNDLVAGAKEMIARQALQVHLVIEPDPVAEGRLGLQEALLVAAQIPARAPPAANRFLAHCVASPACDKRHTRPPFHPGVWAGTSTLS